MSESCGPRCENAVLEGKIVDLSIPKKVGVKWIRLKGQPVQYDGSRHKLFKTCQRKYSVSAGSSAHFDDYLTSLVSASATHEADHFSSSSEEESLAEDAEEADENDDRISIIGREWGSNLTLDAFDCRPAANIYSNQPKLTISSGGGSLRSMLSMEVFRLFVPKTLFESIVYFSVNDISITEVMRFTARMYAFRVTKLKSVRDDLYNFCEVLGMTDGSFDSVRKNIRFGPNHNVIKSYEETNNLAVNISLGPCPVQRFCRAAGLAFFHSSRRSWHTHLAIMCIHAKCQGIT